MRKCTLLNQWPATEEQIHSRLLMMRQRLQINASCWQGHQLRNNNAEVAQARMNGVNKKGEGKKMMKMEKKILSADTYSFC